MYLRLQTSVLRQLCVHFADTNSKAEASTSQQGSAHASVQGACHSGTVRRVKQAHDPRPQDYGGAESREYAPELLHTDVDQLAGVVRVDPSDHPPGLAGPSTPTGFSPRRHNTRWTVEAETPSWPLTPVTSGTGPAPRR